MEAGRRYSARKRNTATQKVSYKYILEQYGYWCHICDKIILPHHKLHFDHVIPLKRGGSHTEDNIKPAHGVCNTRKGIKLLEEMEVNQRRGPDDLLSDVTAQIMWLY
jgi:5-methylcytosine-specific restriction endonuclease McrA